MHQCTERVATSQRSSFRGSRTRCLLPASVNFVERLKRLAPLARFTQHNEPPQWGHHAAEVLSQFRCSSRERPKLTYSVEKLSDRDRRKNPTALESLKFPRAEGTAAFDDLRAQIRSVRYTSRFPRIFGRISIQLKHRFDPGKEFFNRIDRNLPSKGRGVEWVLTMSPSRRFTPLAGNPA